MVGVIVSLLILLFLIVVIGFEVIVSLLILLFLIVVIGPEIISIPLVGFSVFYFSQVDWSWSEDCILSLACGISSLFLAVMILITALDKRGIIDIAAILGR